MKKTIYILIILIITFNSVASAHEKPNSLSFSDYCGAVSDTAKSYINSKNDILFSATGAKIIFVTTNSTNSLDTDDYGEYLYKKWSINTYGKGNSIFVLISLNNNDYYIKQGKNIRLVFADSEIDKYIVNYFEKYFSKGNYDMAVLNLYNAFGKWYESKYTNLKLGLDDDIGKYVSSVKTKEPEKKKNSMKIWVAIGVCIIFGMFALKIKRNIDLKIRSHERRMLKKKYKIDIDKIVNS